GQGGQQVAGDRPEDPGVEDPQACARQHVIDPDVARLAQRSQRCRTVGRPGAPGLMPPCNALASTAPALRGVRVVLTRGCSSSWLIAPSTESPSSGSAFWSPAITNLSPGR